MILESNQIQFFEVGVDELQILFMEYVWFLVVDEKRMNEYALEDLKASLNK